MKLFRLNAATRIQPFQVQKKRGRAEERGPTTTTAAKGRVNGMS